jgi:hypothetical protein
VIRPTCQKSRNAAGGESDDKDDDTRGFHNASLSTEHAAAHEAATATPTHRPNASRLEGFQQVNVKAWLMRRIQIELVVGHSMDSARSPPDAARGSHIASDFMKDVSG